MGSIILFITVILVRVHIQRFSKLDLIVNSLAWLGSWVLDSTWPLLSSKKATFDHLIKLSIQSYNITTDIVRPHSTFPDLPLPSSLLQGWLCLVTVLMRYVCINIILLTNTKSVRVTDSFHVRFLVRFLVPHEG